MFFLFFKGIPLAFAFFFIFKGYTLKKQKILTTYKQILINIALLSISINCWVSHLLHVLIQNLDYLLFLLFNGEILNFVSSRAIAIAPFLLLIPSWAIAIAPFLGSRSTSVRPKKRIRREAILQRALQVAMDSVISLKNTMQTQILYMHMRLYIYIYIYIYIYVFLFFKGIPLDFGLFSFF